MDAEWREDHKPILRAEFVRRLLLRLEPDWTLRGAGLRVRGAQIEGALDLAECVDLPSLALERCDIPEPLWLNAASLRRLSLRHSRLRALIGAGLSVERDVDFQGIAPAPTPDGASATAFLRLRNARIGGDLRLYDARLAEPSGRWPGEDWDPYALNAQNAEIAGTLFFDKAQIDGQFWLFGARIGGGMNGGGAQVRAPGRTALNANNARLGGDVFLGRSEIEGCVHFFQSDIAGALNCSHARLRAAPSDAAASLQIQGGRIGGDVSFTGAFQTARGVFVFGARIEGSVFVGSYGDASAPPTFEAGPEGALVLGYCAIGGAFAAESAVFRGMVSLEATSIERSLDLNAVRIETRELALDLGGARVQGHAQCADNVIPTRVNLRGAHFGALRDGDVAAWGSARLELEGLRYDDIDCAGKVAETRKAWLARMPRFSPDPYRTLAALLERKGLYADARAIAMAEQRAARRAGPRWLAAISFLFADLPFGYGLSPLRAAITIVLIWLLGWLGVEAMAGRGALVLAGESVACGNAIAGPLYALDVALPFPDLGQEGKCEPGVAPGAALAPGLALPLGLGRFGAELDVWRWAKALYALLAAAGIGFARLTLSGVFRPRGQG